MAMMGGMKRKQTQIGKSPIIGERVRRIGGGFCFVPHRFLQAGFLASLEHHELILYFFLVLAGDRNGVSYYRCETICGLLCLENGEYLIARNGLIEKDLIAFDGRRFQVLSLPERPTIKLPRSLCTREDFETHDRATIREIIEESFGTASK